MTKNLKTSPLGDRLVSCGNMYECSPGMEARQRRYRCWCPSCAGRAEQPVSADHWHINASLGRALSQAKRAGFLWRQRAREQQRSLFWLKQVFPGIHTIFRRNPFTFAAILLSFGLGIRVLVSGFG